MYSAAYQERGQLRSGKRFAARNNPYYGSLAEVLKHHKRLFNDEPAVTTRLCYIGGKRRKDSRAATSLMQTTVRYRTDYAKIEEHLKDVFVGLFREYTQDASGSGGGGFEVVVTFNAVLSDSHKTSFSVFYGHDHRAYNFSGAAPQLRHSERATVVRSLQDVEKVPTSFDFEHLLRQHSQSFADSNVSVYKFVSIVYLIYRLVERRGRRRATRKNGDSD